MASAIYSKFKEALLGGVVDLTSDTVKVCLVDTGTYTFSDSHEFHSDLSGVIATTSALSGKTITSGIFNADDTVFSSVSGAQSEALILFIDTGVSATSRLICYIDSGTGLPVTPNGGDINVVWDNGTNKIFKL